MCGKDSFLDLFNTSSPLVKIQQQNFVLNTLQLRLTRTYLSLLCTRRKLEFLGLKVFKLENARQLARQRKRKKRALQKFWRRLRVARRDTIFPPKEEEEWSWRGTWALVPKGTLLIKKEYVFESEQKYIA